MGKPALVALQPGSAILIRSKDDQDRNRHFTARATAIAAILHVYLAQKLSYSHWIFGPGALALVVQSLYAPQSHRILLMYE
jgi:hypothetical protein